MADEIKPALTPKNPAAQELGRLGGLKGGKARAAQLSPERRAEIARNAARARWASPERPRLSLGDTVLVFRNTRSAARGTVLGLWYGCRGMPPYQSAKSLLWSDVNALPCDVQVDVDGDLYWGKDVHPA